MAQDPVGTMIPGKGESLAGFDDFVTELKRRRVVRALAVWGVLSFAILRATQLPGALAWIVVGLLVAIVGSLIVYAMAHSIRAEDVEAEIPAENVLAVPVTLHPHLEGHGPAA